MSFSDAVFNFLHDNKGLPFRSMTVFNFLLEATLCGALLILLVLLVRRFLRRRPVGRKVLFLWLLVAIRLLVPVAIPNPLMNDLRPTLSTDSGARPVADQFRVRFQDATSDLSRQLDTNRGLKGPENVSTRLSHALLDLSAYTSYGWTGKWFLFAYLTADGVILCVMIIQNARFRRRLNKNRAGTLSGEALASYRKLCDRLRVKPLPVFLVEGLPNACLVGVIRPYVALPRRVSDPAPALARVLFHLKSHDEWWGLLRCLCCIIHWFNPLVWVAAHCARADAETACDACAGRLLSEAGASDSQQASELYGTGKSAPGILILSTAITLRARAKTQGEASHTVRPHERKWTSVLFYALSVLVLLASFCTAESYAPGYNLVLQKAINGHQLDDPYPEADEVYRRAPVTVRPIRSAAEAVEQVNRYLNTDYFGNVAMERTDLRYSAYHAPEGWYVAATATDDEAYCFLLGEDGRLLKYNGDVYSDTATESNSRLPMNILQAMASYMNAFAVDCLGSTSTSNPAINEDTYDLDRRYLACQMDIDGKTCGFLFCVSPYPHLLQFYTDVPAKTVFTQEQVLYSLWAYARDSLGLKAEQRSASCDFTVEWLAGSERWYATARIPAYAVGEDTLAKLQALYGDRSIYTLQVECTADGTGSDRISVIDPSIPDDAASQNTQRVTDVYFDACERWLYVEETVPAGIPYTVVQTLAPQENTFAQDWAKGHTWLRIRYVSPAYGGVMTRWILSPDEVIALSPKVKVDANGKPEGWRLATLPDDFWTAMEKLGGGDWATASVLLQGWKKQYGENLAAWPLEGQAMWDLWMNEPADSTEISLLPQAGDLTQEQALQIADASFRKAWEESYPGQAMPEKMSHYVSFLCDLQRENQRFWYVQYIDAGRSSGDFCGDVKLNAVTGEVEICEAIVGGNG